MNVGFFGLGTMGLPMAKNLQQKSGYPIIGYDPVPERMSEFEKSGGKSTGDVKGLYNTCEIIFLCLPNNNVVESTISSIIQNGRKGTIIVDLSSTSPSIIQRLCQEALYHDMSLLDSPVSGGEIGAINGKLVMLCGGDREVFNKVEPLLKCMGSTVTLLGKSGSGDIAKLANNMILACSLASMAEAFAYVAKAGLNTLDFYNAIKDGFASSVALTARGPKMIEHDFTPSARLSIHQKDLRNALSFAQEMGVEIPMTNMVLDFMNELTEMGCANEDHSVLSKLYEQKMDTRL